MATTRQSQTTQATRHTVQYRAGQRLHCSNCQSEVEIISPCTCQPSQFVLQCCGQDMKPLPGKDVHLDE